MHCVPGVEMTLLKSSFAVMMLAVLVLTSPKYSTWSPPMVQHTRCGMVFSGRCVQTMRKYVAHLPFGIAETGMKNMVLVPGMLSLPWASWWISSALAACQRSPSELWLSFLYLASLPVSGLKAFPWSAMNCKHRSGELVWVAWRARKHAEQWGRRWERHGGMVVTTVGVNAMCWERLSVRMVASLGVASVDTLRDAAGFGGVSLLFGAPGGGILTGMAGVGGSRGA